jgi:cytochrome b subunit of formate dehydrogenase
MNIDWNAVGWVLAPFLLAAVVALFVLVSPVLYFCLFFSVILYCMYRNIKSENEDRRKHKKWDEELQQRRMQHRMSE